MISGKSYKFYKPVLLARSAKHQFTSSSLVFRISSTTSARTCPANWWSKIMGAHPGAPLPEKMPPPRRS